MIMRSLCEIHFDTAMELLSTSKVMRPLLHLRRMLDNCMKLKKVAKGVVYRKIARVSAEVG